MKVFAIAIYSHILKYYNGLFEKLLKEYQITQVEVDVLAFLANNPEYCYAQDIVEVRKISKAHVSIAIEKLVKRGYLIRQPDPKNRRCNILKITDQANEIVCDIKEIQETFNQQIYADLSKEERAIYDQYLVKMYKNIGGKVDE
ncbi:MAG: MarR family winged helix-turn-helix transcriptional regulator [Thomasclavelia sp.]